MFKLKIKGVPNNITEEEFLQLGAVSDLYSGSDISIVSNEALFNPIRKCQNATKFLKLPNGKMTPVSPSDPNGVEMDMYSIDEGML